MAEGQLQVEPAVTVFIAPFNTAKTVHALTNNGANKLTIKVKVTQPELLVAKPFMMIEPGESAPLACRCKLEGAPDPAKNYAIGLVYADAPADLANDMNSMKEAWANIKEFKSLRLPVEFKESADAPGQEECAPAQ